MLTREDLAAVLEPFERARPLPAAAFTEPEVLALEERALFAEAWLPVAHVSDLERPGQWARAPVRGEQLVVVRTAELALAALHATCAHRGTLLCDGDGGQLRDLAIRCPYHGWTYGTDGALLAAPGRREGEAAGLETARVEVRNGVVFVNREPRAPGLDACWDGGPAWLASLAALPLARVHRADHEVRANWKVLVGNFQESHHFPAVHPGLEARTPWKRSATSRSNACSPSSLSQYERGRARRVASPRCCSSQIARSSALVRSQNAMTSSRSTPGARAPGCT